MNWQGPQWPQWRQWRQWRAEHWVRDRERAQRRQRGRRRFSRLVAFLGLALIGGPSAFIGVVCSGGGTQPPREMIAPFPTPARDESLTFLTVPERLPPTYNNMLLEHWEFDTRLKPVQGFPLYYGWIGATPSAMSAISSVVFGP